MKHILFISPYPAGESPSQRFRFEQYLPLLRHHNYKYEEHPFWQPKTWQILYKKGRRLDKLLGFIIGATKRLFLLGKIHKFDYIFIHREAIPIGPPIWEWFATFFNKKIIYDFDDAIWTTDKENESSIDKVLRWRTKVSSICKWSYKVSCGNEYLCDFARQFNPKTFKNPTTIDTNHVHNPALYVKRKTKNQIIVGWTGTHSTLKYLYEVEEVLIRLENELGNILKFVVIADQAPSLNLKNLTFIRWRKETEIEDLLNLDIGIMPIPDNLWAQGKCGFKLLQYMALAIPTVASPVGVNNIIVTHEVSGYLCDTQQQWYDKLKNLINNETLRKSFGSRGRAYVIENFSVSSNTGNFLSFFD